MTITATTLVLPNFFIIGSPKCGTTSLHNYLADHPEISMSEPKEPRTFSSARWREELGGFAAMLDAGAPVRGESSTTYTRWPAIQFVPERVASHCPTAKLVYAVRDPIDRIVAQYSERYSQLQELRTLGGALWDLDQPANYYVAPSRYATQLERWLEHFPREQVLVLDQADLRDDRAKTVREVLEFLGVEPTVPVGVEAEFNTNAEKERMTPAAARLWFSLSPLTRRLPPRAEKTLLRSSLFPVEKVGKPALDAELRTALVAELSEEMRRFRALTGKDFASWSI
jgi:hypothetical protein